MARSRGALDPSRPGFTEEPWRTVSTISPDELTIAVELPQAGHVPEAARLYEAFLEHNPAHPDALHLLGIAWHQLGQPDLAAELIGQAAALCPRAAVFR